MTRYYLITQIKSNSMYTNQIIFKRLLSFIFTSLIILCFFNCTPEDISDIDPIDTIEADGGTEDPDITIDIPTTNPVTEPPTSDPVTEEPATNPVIAEPTDEDIEVNLAEARALLILVNEARAAEGLNSLVLNTELNKAALSHSIDMNVNDYFDHEGLNGSRFWERAKDAGYTGSPVGENIALGQRDTEAVHNAWMNSDGHRRNILNSSITEMGLGHNGRYWTQIFGRSN